MAATSTTATAILVFVQKARETTRRTMPAIQRPASIAPTEVVIALINTRNYGEIIVEALKKLKQM
jgi:hypothetical protein